MHGNQSGEFVCGYWGLKSCKVAVKKANPNIKEGFFPHFREGIQSDTM